MNEDELRAALHHTLATLSAPPPMDCTEAVTAGKKSLRRRTVLAGAAVVAAVAVVSVAVGVWPHPAGREKSIPAAARPTPAAPSVQPSTSASSREPQGDATASSGPHYAQGSKLLNQVLAVVPAGYTTPTGTVGAGTSTAPLRGHEAQVAGSGWNYSASVAVARNGGTGRLLAEVYTAGAALPADPCALAQAFWSIGGQCTVVTVGSAKVGVMVKPGTDKRLDQWAAYHYPDGTAVFVAQSRRAANLATTLPALTTLPLTVPQLPRWQSTVDSTCPHSLPVEPLAAPFPTPHRARKAQKAWPASMKAMTRCWSARTRRRRSSTCPAGWPCWTGCGCSPPSAYSPSIGSAWAPRR